MSGPFSFATSSWTPSKLDNTSLSGVPVEFDLSSQKLAFRLTLIVIGLGLAHLLTQSIYAIGGHDYQLGLLPLFSLDSESNIPSWYQSAALLLCAVMLAVIGAAKKKRNDSYSFHWKLMAVIFLFLSIDEAVGIHELATLPLRNAFSLGKWFFYSWIILGIPVVLSFGFVYLKFVIHLPSVTRNSFLLAGTVYVGAALGIEAVSGAYASVYGESTFSYSLLVALEEVGEMIGIVIFIDALSLYIFTSIRQVQIVLHHDGSSAPT